MDTYSLNMTYFCCGMIMLQCLYIKRLGGHFVWNSTVHNMMTGFLFDTFRKKIKFGKCCFDFHWYLTFSPSITTLSFVSYLWFVFLYDNMSLCGKYPTWWDQLAILKHLCVSLAFCFSFLIKQLKTRHLVTFNHVYLLFIMYY